MGIDLNTHEHDRSTRRELRDARGIFCTYICDQCERQKRAKFRADIFGDPDYWTDEAVED